MKQFNKKGKELIDNIYNKWLSFLKKHNFRELNLI